MRLWMHIYYDPHTKSTVIERSQWCASGGPAAVNAPDHGHRGVRLHTCLAAVIARGLILLHNLRSQHNTYR